MGLSAIATAWTRRISTRTATERTDRTRDPRKTSVGVPPEIRIALYLRWFSSCRGGGCVIRTSTTGSAPKCRDTWRRVATSGHGIDRPPPGVLSQSAFRAGVECSLAQQFQFGGRREEDISAPSQEPQADPRVSQAHEDPRRARGPAPPPPPRPQAADRQRLQEVGRRSMMAAGGEGFPRARRVRKRLDYLRVQNQGRRYSTPHFLVFAHGLDRGADDALRRHREPEGRRRGDSQSGQTLDSRVVPALGAGAAAEPGHRRRGATSGGPRWFRPDLRRAC